MDYHQHDQHYQQFVSSQLIYQRSFNLNQCIQFLKDALEKMEQQGYDFDYSSRQKLNGRAKRHFPKDRGQSGIYMRFECTKDKRHRWTTMCGTVLIYFTLTKDRKLVQQKRKYPYLLVFHLKIFKMQCQKCRIYGIPYLYQSRLIRLSNRFCKIIADILDNKPPPERKPRIEKPTPDLIKHRTDLCQACKQGTCCIGNIIQLKENKNKNTK